MRRRRGAGNRGRNCLHEETAGRAIRRHCATRTSSCNESAVRSGEKRHPDQGVAGAGSRRCNRGQRAKVTGRRDGSVAPRAVAFARDFRSSGAISALKCWGAFADAVLEARGAHLPPDVNGLVIWSRLFRNSRTFSNYLSKLRFGCEIAGACAVSVLALPRRTCSVIGRCVDPEHVPSFAAPCKSCDSETRARAQSEKVHSHGTVGAFSCNGAARG